MANQNRASDTPKFDLPIKGIAVVVSSVAKMRLLGWEEFCKQGPEAYKSACSNCEYLLSLGGRTVIEYDCFPVEMMHETIRKMKENKVKISER